MPFFLNGISADGSVVTGEADTRDALCAATANTSMRPPAQAGIRSAHDKTRTKLPRAQKARNKFGLFSVTRIIPSSGAQNDRYNHLDYVADNPDAPAQQS